MDPFDNHTPGFVADIVDGRPYAVRADVAVNDTGKDSQLTREDLAKVTTQAYVVDAPMDLTRPPDPNISGFVALAAKEGHGIGREGVALVDTMVPPPRRAAPSRRPVVALVDSPVLDHPWLDPDSEADPFWTDARTGPDAWDPFGDLDPALEFGFAAMGQDDAWATHAGHGTFLAGLVRQIAPEARVLSVPVMRKTGVVDDQLVQSALAWLVDRCTRAQNGRPELAVDVVNLSFGQYLRGGKTIPENDPLLASIRALGDLGVRVVTSAGNRATDDPVVPAAWALDDEDRPAAPAEPGAPAGVATPVHTALVAVGALDPNGDPARYSNTGAWVRTHAPGTALVSTLPHFSHVDFPDKAHAGKDVGEDPNLQASGFGRWAGTSFAAGWLTATIARHLSTAADLHDVSSPAAHVRAAAALLAAKDDVADWQAKRAAG